MLEDATHELGGAAIQKASVYNVETFFGWVSTVDHFCRTFAPAAVVSRVPAEAVATATA